jgi:hypothetical protein
MVRHGPHPSTAYTVAHANWISDRQFQARYQAADKIFSLSVKAFGAKDVAGNVQVNYCGTTTITGTTIGSQVGLFDPVESVFYLNTEDSGDSTTRTIALGTANAGWTSLVGDWNGDGGSDLGVYDPVHSKLYLTDAFVSGFARYTFGFGVANAGWQPLVGDWNGDTMVSVGLYDPHSSTFYLADALTTGYAQHTFGYGEAGGGWIPLVGDWNGNGAAGVGLFDPAGSTFYLTNNLAGGFAEVTFHFGRCGAGWQPVIGTWPAADEEVLDVVAVDLVASAGDVAKTDSERLTDLVLERL